MENFGGKRSFGRGGTALYITLAAAFLLIALFVAMAVFFKITDITVEGAQKYSAQEIIDASGVELDGSIFFLNAGSAQIAIKNALPYVDTVKISRNLPGTVSITVTESVAAAYFTSGGSQWVIDLGGRILEERVTVPAGLPEVRGITAKDPKAGKNLDLGSGETVRLRGLKEFLETLEIKGRLDLTTSIDMTNLSSVVFEYNGYKINIGEIDDLDHKFSALDNAFKRLTDPGYGQWLIYDKGDGGMHYNP